MLFNTEIKLLAKKRLHLSIKWNPSRYESLLEVLLLSIKIISWFLSMSSVLSLVFLISEYGSLCLKAIPEPINHSQQMISYKYCLLLSIKFIRYSELKPISKLFSLEHDAGGRFLIVTFFEYQKKEDIKQEKHNCNSAC